MSFMKTFTFELTNTRNWIVLCFLLFISIPAGPCISNGSSLYNIKEDLFGVFFVNEEHGWICGRWGTILRTNDGGKNWNLQNSGTDLTLSAIYFENIKIGWAVGERGIILHTDDGGKKWVQQPSPIDKYLMSVCFVDDKTGWIAGESSNILHTKDGGQTWSVQFSNNEYMLKKIDFCDSMTGWAVGEYGFIYHTSDGGSNWICQAGHFCFLTDTFEIKCGSTLFDIVSLSPRTAFAVGIAGTIKKTDDGGATWDSIRLDFQSNKPFFAVTVGDDGNTVLIAGQDNFAVSNNGGKSFEIAKSLPSIQCHGWIYKIVPRDKSGYVAVGNAGSIYLSDDNGKEWTHVDWMNDE